MTIRKSGRCFISSGITLADRFEADEEVVQPSFFFGKKLSLMMRRCGTTTSALGEASCTDPGTGEGVSSIRKRLADTLSESE